MRIIVMCAAGASSTFVVQRLRDAIAGEGSGHTARVASLSSWPACLSDTDVLLLGPHMAGQADQLSEQAARHGVAVALLPEDIFTDRDGHRALALAAAVMRPPADSMAAPPRERAEERNDT
jgi:PTS system cellobiose-specific IIB component